MWPSQIEYQDALQEPRSCFADPGLQTATPADWTPFGLPLPITGQFANVYRLRRADGVLVAVRLFKGAQSDRTRRYAAITAHFAALNKVGALPSCIVPVQYQAQGILIDQTWYPVVVSPWINGVPLNHWVDENRENRDAVVVLAERWRRLLANLTAARIAHGDLQHGNILVETLDTGELALRLIDYDGMFVPSLWGEQSRETGHPAYQHPARTTFHFGPTLDRFSALVIYVALRAVAVDATVWPTLDNGDNMLFRREDFVQSEQSRAFFLLVDALRWNPSALHSLIAIRDACRSLPTLIPPLDQL